MLVRVWYWCHQEQGGSPCTRHHTTDILPVCCVPKTLLFFVHGSPGRKCQFHQQPPLQELFYWVEELVRDLPNHVQLHHITNTDPDRVILKPGWITKNPIFPKLTPKERLMIWEQKQCPHPEGHEFRHTCDEFFFKVG